MTILRAATRETERGDDDSCLSQSHYTDTDSTSEDRTQDLLTRSRALYRLNYASPSTTTINQAAESRVPSLVTRPNRWSNILVQNMIQKQTTEQVVYDVCFVESEV